MVWYDTVLHNTMSLSPLNKYRRPTNTIITGIFVIFMIAYCGIAVYAFTNSDIKNLKRTKENNDLYSLMIFINYINDQKWKILFVCFTYSILIMAVFLYILKSKLSSYVIKVGAGLDFLYISIFIASYIFATIKGNITFHIVEFMIYFLLTWGLYVKIYTMKKVGCTLMNLVVQEVCKVITRFSGIIQLNLLLPVLIFGVLMFGINVFVHLCFIDSNVSSLLMILFHIVNIYCTIWLSFSLVVFSRTVSSGTIATWYWSADKDSIPENTTLLNIRMVFKYHIGTIVYISSLCTVFSVIWIMIKSLMNQTKKSSCNIFVLVVCWFNVFLKIYDSSIAATAIHGTNFSKSTKKVCQLYLRSPVQLYAITKTYEWCNFMAFYNSTIIICILALWIQPPHEDSETHIMLFQVLSCMIFISMPFTLTLQSATSQIFYCILEDNRHGNKSISKKNFMNPQIKYSMQKIEF